MDGNKSSIPARRFQASDSADGSAAFSQPSHQVVSNSNQMALRDHRRSAPSAAAIREDVVRLPSVIAAVSADSNTAQPQLQYPLSAASAANALPATASSNRTQRLSTGTSKNEGGLSRSGSVNILSIDAHNSTVLAHASGTVSSFSDVVNRRPALPQVSSNTAAVAPTLNLTRASDADMNSSVVQCVPPVSSSLVVTGNSSSGGKSLLATPRLSLIGNTGSPFQATQASANVANACNAVSASAVGVTERALSSAHAGSSSALPAIVSSQQHASVSQAGVPGLDFTLAASNSLVFAGRTAASLNENSLPSASLFQQSNVPLFEERGANKIGGDVSGVRLPFVSDKHAKVCLDVFNNFRQAEDLIDVHVVVDEKRIPCHKIVLAASSPYFRAMFTSGYYDESKQSTRQVVIHDVDASATELLISYIYTGKIVLDEENVQLLLPVARLFHLNEVVDKCCEFLKDQLDPHNCLGIRNFADTYSCAELKEQANKFATQNFLHVVQNDEFLMLHWQQLQDIIKSEELNCPNEEEVFNACIRWFSFDAVDRQPFLIEVMQHVRFSLLKPEFLIGTVCTNVLLRSCTRCRDLIDEAKDYHLLPAIRTQQQGERFRPRRMIPAELLFAVGGWCSGDAINTVERYDSQQNEWRCVQPMSERRCGVGVAVLDGTIYAVGGHNGQQYLNSVERYDSLNNAWHSDVTNTKCCRTSVGVAVMDGYLYAVGGQDGVSCLNIVERYDPKTNRWTQVQAMTEKRLGVAVGVLNGCLYACGGSNGEFPLSSVEKYELKTDRWTPCAPMRTKRKHLGCAVVDGYLYAAGGRDDQSELATCERYDPRRDVWELIAPMNSHRSGVGLAVVNGMLYACGGFDGSAYLKNCECYDAATDSWRTISNMNYRRLGGGVAVLKVARQVSTTNVIGVVNAGGLVGSGLNEQSGGGGVGGAKVRSPTWNPLG